MLFRLRSDTMGAYGYKETEQAQGQNYNHSSAAHESSNAVVVAGG